MEFSMYRWLPQTVLFAFLLCVIGCGGGDEAAIKASFEGYKKAVLAKDGAAAASLVDQKTLDYYGSMQDLALNGSADDVRKMRSVMDKMMVLVIRQRMDVSQLKGMTSADLFSYAVEQGWVGSQVASNGMTDVVVAENTATATHVLSGQETPVKWQFRKEGDAWKLDLTSIMSLGDDAMRKLMRQMGANEDEFLLQLVAQVGGPVDEAIWEPMATPSAVTE